MEADLLLTTGRLITLDDRVLTASAMAVKDGRIVAVGADAEIKKHPAVQEIDLHGKTVTPGFIDSHIHLFAYGEMLLRQAELVGSGSIDEILARLRTLQLRRPTGWLPGHGFDNDKMRDK